MELLDLNLVRVLEAMFTQRSVTGAARMLGVTQPSVSLALRRLRAHFKDDLFIRQDGVMVPTSVAEALSEPVMRMMASVRTELTVTEPFDTVSAQRCFTIHLSDLGELTFLPRLMTRIRLEAPGVSIRSLTLPQHELRGGLADGTVDLALGFFLGLEGDNLFTQTLFEQGFSCLVRSGWKNGTTVLTLADFLAADHAVVEQEGRSQVVLEQRLRALDLQRRIVLRSPHFMTVPLLIAQSDMMTTVPLGVGRIYSRIADLRLFDCPFDAPVIPLQQLWHRRSHNDPGSIWLRRLIADCFLGRDPTIEPSR